MSKTLEPRGPNAPAEPGQTTEAAPDIITRLRGVTEESMYQEPWTVKKLCEEAAEAIFYLRRQSRGHFEALSVVMRDGIEGLLPETPPKKAN